MSLYKQVLRPLAFQIDAETVHERAMWALRRGFFKARDFSDRRLEQELFGVRFPNPLGLAAGFDKNAEALDYWHKLGFGFVECGTITFHAQAGNPKPRLFRLSEDQALINRMGFNNVGARSVAMKLASANSSIPVGVNIGKSKVAEVENAGEDYQESFRLLHPFGQYFAINVSSPNTPGLRTLQEKGPLEDIVRRVKRINSAKPLFIKVAPDLELSALDDVIDVAHTEGVTGLIATNTTISREGLSRPIDEQGGLSGKPLRKVSDHFLSHLYRTCDPSMILMGVGGIFTGADLYRKIRLGAHLAQVYTGWIYEGPHMVPDVLMELVALMEKDGFDSIAVSRGTLTSAS